MSMELPFDNPLFLPTGRSLPKPTPVEDGGPPEARDAYDFRDARIVAAVNVALAARRPLLVTGDPGSGKSTLARAVAREKRWTYLETVVTSRTEIGDLTAGFDAVRRLADAQIPRRLLPDWTYVEPGVLWWAFAPETAPYRGHDPATELEEHQQKRLPPVVDPRVPGDSRDSVVLIDEIDKAEPDLPNDLLQPLDQQGFTTREAGWIAAAHDVFVIITSNGERRLPPAFLRRCVQLHVEASDPDFYEAVATAHFGARTDGLFADVAAQHLAFRTAAAQRNRRMPSTAEFLDTVRACLRYGQRPGSEGWNAIVEAALWKEPALPRADGGDGAGPAP
jgi:MoxR-like ATPase